MAPKLNATVIHVVSTKLKMIDFYSCMRFIEANINDIDPKLYNDYHSYMLGLAIKHSATDDIIKHYIKELVRYKAYLSY